MTRMRAGPGRAALARRRRRGRPSSGRCRRRRSPPPPPPASPPPPPRFLLLLLLLPLRPGHRLLRPGLHRRPGALGPDSPGIGSPPRGSQHGSRRHLGPSAGARARGWDWGARQGSSAPGGARGKVRTPGPLHGSPRSWRRGTGAAGGDGVRPWQEDARPQLNLLNFFWYRTHSDLRVDAHLHNPQCPRIRPDSHLLAGTPEHAPERTHLRPLRPAPQPLVGPLAPLRPRFGIPSTRSFSSRCAEAPPSFSEGMPLVLQGPVVSKTRQIRKLSEARFSPPQPTFCLLWPRGLREGFTQIREDFLNSDSSP